MCSKFKIATGSLILSAGFFASGCNETKPAQAADTAHAAPTTSKAEPGPRSEAPSKSDDGFIASGPLVVEHQVDVATQRDGVVAQILADSGSLVKEGEILALLDDRQVTADLEAARARTRSTEADLHNWEAEAKVLHSDYERAQKMWDAELITKEELEHAKFKAESDQWEVKRVQESLVHAQRTEQSLQLELDKTRIRAPFAGIIARRYVRAGQQVAKNDRMFWVTATAPLRVKFTLPERWLGTLKRGQMLEVSSEAASADVYRARVIEISPVVDPSSATIEVLAELVGSTKDLRPGMTTNVRIARP